MGSAISSVAGMAKGVLGMGGEIASSIATKNAMNKAGKQQSKALDKIKKYTEENMDPALLAAKAKEQDIQNAKDRLALQAQIDPELAKQRQISQQMQTEQLLGIGKGASDEVAAITAKEAIAGVPGMDAAKKELIDAALAEIRLGAKLPPDVQAELMQAGLQQAGQVTGAAGGAAGGVGSSILSQVLGTAGLKLRSDRQTQAANLATAASNLESQRQNILQTLFPKLQEQQLMNMKATSGVLQQSDAMVPQAGLSGTDVANAWLARVGALNKLSQQKASVQTNAALAARLAGAQGWGAAMSAGQREAGGLQQATSKEGGGGDTLLGGVAGFFN